MSPGPRVSLIIVSRNRRAELGRILASLRYLTCPEFEVIVVGDTDPATAFPGLWRVERIAYVPFDRANISAARNLGLAAAAGEIVAFCDDDAVPEATWLDHLIAPFADPGVGAAGGHVLGRNGIALQWGGGRIDRFGNRLPLDLPGDAPVVLAGDGQSGVKTEGTNCAFRRAALVALGGFDESYRYFLDETDLNLRLGDAGWKTAIVPLAQVHHGYAANAARRHDRTPRDLFEIGASKAYFCARHAPERDIPAELAGFRALQRARLIAAMVDGLIEPFAVDRIMASLEAGFTEGAARQPQHPGLGEPDRGFCRYGDSGPSAAPMAIACRPLTWRNCRNSVLAAAAAGQSLTVFRLSLTTLFHRMEFQPEGYWLQKGGIFGRSERRGALFRRATLKSRAGAEIDRLQAVRPIAGLRICSKLPLRGKGIIL
ncbi:MAG: glycosyltransferase [Rhodobacteraceae bacterium]|nr:glycosyltransferase [Paracoccaceae bacterium]